MHKPFGIAIRVFVVAAVLCGCVEEGGIGDDPGGGDPGPGSGSDMTPPPPPPPPTPPPVGDGVTGRWTGMFNTDSTLASKGSFQFDLTEDTSTHAVTGPFTGTVTEGLGNGTAFKGTFSGMRSGNTISNGVVAVTEPMGVTGNFNFMPATINGTQIAGDFEIAVAFGGLPVNAKGGYSVAK